MEQFSTFVLKYLCPRSKSKICKLLSRGCQSCRNNIEMQANQKTTNNNMSVSCQKGDMLVKENSQFSYPHVNAEKQLQTIVSMVGILHKLNFQGHKMPFTCG